MTENVKIFLMSLRLWELVVVTNLHVSERLMAVSDIFSSQTVEYAKLSWNVQERWTVVTLNGQEHLGTF